MRQRDQRLVYARGKWEIAHKEQFPLEAGSRLSGSLNWIRSDMSWICRVGDEMATLPLPPKPQPKKESGS